MGVTVASRLERLARFVPGVAGYQDRERARATDKQVRMRLVDELRRLRGAIEQDKARLAESGNLANLPALDRLDGRLERLARAIEFAGRGYAGLFDLHPVDRETLEQLYAFDVGLFEALSAARARTEALRASLTDPAALTGAIGHMTEALDDFEQLFDKRRRIVDAD
jgi:hypothetical protein